MLVARFAGRVPILSLFLMAAAGCGLDGSSATVTAEPAGANCANGGSKVQVGEEAPSYVCNGAKGDDGVAGTGATVAAEAAGANCPAGGVKIQSGTGAPVYACDGADGAAGQNVTVTAEAPGANCSAGGVKVQSGTGTPVYACNASSPKYYVFVRGHLASATQATNKTAHDAIVTTHRGTVTAAGDEKHLALLGMTDPQNFLGIDVWNSYDGMNTFLSDPAVQAAFGTLFDAPPTVTVVVAPSGYLVWGALAPKPGTWAVSVRGTLNGATWNANQAAHNQVAGGGQAGANALGDYAHLVYLSPADATAFQAVDLWDSATGMNTFLTDPAVGAAFGSMFTGAPTIDIYQTSDFAQY